MVKGAKKDSQHHHQPVNIGILEACLIGLVAAFGAVILKHGVGLVGSIRVSLSHDHTWLLPVIGLTGGVVAGLLLQYVVPEASGSGIPQTKATLYGIQMPLGIRLALVKLVGCIASLGSGMALGREGPTVHVAAALSSKVSLWIRTSPTHRIQLIAAGAGAGLAAAFNAPLAGVLFVLEELLQKMSGLAVGTTVVACFVASVTSRLVGVHSLDVNFSELAPKATFTAYDIPFVILLGIAAGVIGSLFNKCIIQSLTFTRDVVKKPFYITCGLAGLLTGLILMVCPFMQNYALLRQTLVEGELGIGVVSQALLAGIVGGFGRGFSANANSVFSGVTTNADGTLAYTFVESLKATYPYYYVRFLGGLLVLSGMFIMLWNMWRTAQMARDTAPVVVPAPAHA